MRRFRPFAGYAFDSFGASGAAVVVYPEALLRYGNGVRAAVMVSKATKSVEDVGAGGRRRVLVGRTDGDPAGSRDPWPTWGAVLIGSTMPVAGNRTLDRDEQVAVPVLTVHGTADPLAPYDGGTVGYRGKFGKGEHLSALDTAGYFAARNGCNAEPAATTVPHRPIGAGPSR